MVEQENKKLLQNTHLKTTENVQPHEMHSTANFLSNTRMLKKFTSTT